MSPTFRIKNKGRFEIGADGDVVIWSPEKKLKSFTKQYSFRHPITLTKGKCSADWSNKLCSRHKSVR
ncbi:MAG: hypothetical protein IPG90_22040 [Bacteroidetes bacterium]|nr:hypothetical protein [Bacteroidota bacterium]